MDVDSGPASSKKSKSKTKNADDLDEYNLDAYDEEEQGEPGTALSYLKSFAHFLTGHLQEASLAVSRA